MLLDTKEIPSLFVLPQDKVPGIYPAGTDPVALMVLQESQEALTVIWGALQGLGQNILTLKGLEYPLQPFESVTSTTYHPKPSVGLIVTLVALIFLTKVPGSVPLGPLTL